MRVIANAKVNLALDVVAKMENGYHALDMIMAPISLYDEIEIEPNKVDIITCDTMELPERNTITKMLEEIRKVAPIGNYRINVIKNIPEQAGLAGGSADAAGVLKGIIDLEDLKLNNEQINHLCSVVGADVPFCFFNKWARVKGIGEKITGLDTELKLNAILVKPDFGISTPEAFTLWSRIKRYHPDVDLVQIALENQNIDLLYQTMANALEPCAFKIDPRLKQVKEKMEDAGLVKILMTGSGSSMLGFSVDEEILQEAYENLKDQYPFVRYITIGG